MKAGHFVHAHLHIYCIQTQTFSFNTVSKLTYHTTMASYLITGASRGIGLALAGILAAKPVSEVSIVYAAVRTETNALKELIAKSGGRVELVSIDVTSKESVEKAASQVELSLGGKGLDVLICSAGALNSTPGGIENM